MLFNPLSPACPFCSCSDTRPAGRFVRLGSDEAGRCRKCRSVIHLPSVYLRRQVASSALRSVLQQPLQALGASTARWVVVRNARQGVLFLDPEKGKNLS